MCLCATFLYIPLPLIISLLHSKVFFYKLRALDLITEDIMGFLFFLQFIVSLLLILVILLHTPKEQGMGAIGGQARTFGAENELEKGLDRATAVLAIIYMCLAILAIIVS